MSSRNQNAPKRQAKLNSKSSEKSKNEEVTKKEQNNTARRLVTTNKIKTEQNEKIKVTNKTISSKQLQSQFKLPSSPLNSTKKTSSSVLIKKQVSSIYSDNRVQKTQFFPTKQMYTNAVNAVQGSSKDKEHNQVKTQNHSETEVLNKEPNDPIPECSTDRPQTATIKKPSLVKPTSDEYEDDFDSYESDFEEYTSSSKTSEMIETSSSSEEEENKELGIKSIGTEEEHKLDSGNFELPEMKHTQVLDEIKENMNEVPYIEPNRSNLTSLSDEGFEDCKTDKNGQFINFLGAQQRQNQLKSLTVKHKRGEELASMMKLDGQNFTVFEMESTPYSVFIKKFGNNNTVQISTQTGDDNITTETQTNENETTSKWTQYPSKLSEIKKANINFNIYKQESLGVGSDYVQADLEEIKYNEHSLEQFLKCVGNVVLSLVDESLLRGNCKEIDIDSGHIPLSEGYIAFNTKYSHLENMPIIYAGFSNSTTRLVTIHSGKGYSFLSIWRISDPNTPEYSIKIHGNLTCCALSESYTYGGLDDGSIGIWNFQEQYEGAAHQISPSYITNIDTGHSTKIVSIELLENDQNIITDSTCNSQVYSLDEDGYLIVWTVIFLKSVIMNQITLQQSVKYSCKKLYPNLHNLQCTNMAVSPLDINHIFISTNYGQILHLVTTTGTKAIPIKYSAGWVAQSNCVTICPFSPKYILAAYRNGKMVLYSRSTETPLITLTNCEDDVDENAVEFIEWSKNKPCIVYAKDRKNCIHVWDLAISDIFPVCSIPFKEEINFMKLSPNITKDEDVKRSYMVIVSNTCNVNLHVLNKEHGQQDPMSYKNDIKQFLNYVNRL